MAMDNSRYLAELPALFKTVETLTTKLNYEAVKPYTVKTNSEGIATLDYSALGLALPPRILFVPQLANADTAPVFISLIGAPTKSSATLSVKTIRSILGIGILPQYAGVADVTLDVYVRPIMPSS